MNHFYISKSSNTKTYYFLIILLPFDIIYTLQDMYFIFQDAIKINICIYINKGIYISPPGSVICRQLKNIIENIQLTLQIRASVFSKVSYIIAIILIDFVNGFQKYWWLTSVQGGPDLKFLCISISLLCWPAHSLLPVFRGIFRRLLFQDS